PLRRTILVVDHLEAVVGGHDRLGARQRLRAISLLTCGCGRGRGCGSGSGSGSTVSVRLARRIALFPSVFPVAVDTAFRPSIAPLPLPTGVGAVQGARVVLEERLPAALTGLRAPPLRLLPATALHIVGTVMEEVMDAVVRLRVVDVHRDLDEAGAGRA